MRTMMGAALAGSLIGALAMPAAAATHTWQVGDFTRIRLLGPFDVRLRTGAPAGVRATGPQDAIDRVVIEQRGDTLVVAAKPGAWGDWQRRDRTPLVVEAGTRTLAGATVSGSGDLAIDRVTGDALDLAAGGSGDVSVGAVAVRRLGLSINGSGDITVAGRADAATASVGGSGDLHGGALQAGEATVALAGSGDVDLGARRTATVTLSGSGDIAITGPARCTVARRGSGTVTCGGRTDDD